MWFKKKCEIHDIATVRVDLDYDIIKRLEKEGCPIIVNRTVIGLNPSGEAIVSPSTIDIQIGDHVLEHHFNRTYYDQVCVQCEKIYPKASEAEKEWRDYIEEYGGGYKAKIEKRKERKSKAYRIWEKKYDTSK